MDRDKTSKGLWEELTTAAEIRRRERVVSAVEVDKAAWLKDIVVVGLKKKQCSSG